MTVIEILGVSDLDVRCRLLCHTQASTQYVEDERNSLKMLAEAPDAGSIDEPNPGEHLYITSPFVALHLILSPLKKLIRN